MIVVEVIEESGFQSAMRGLSLNKEQPVYKMYEVAKRLAFASEGSHRKFLRQMIVHVYLNLPRYLWCEVDTYKIATVRQSGSTMHNAHKRDYKVSDFMPGTDALIISAANQHRRYYADGLIGIEEFKKNLPEGLLQASVLMLNYETIRTMAKDRKNHRLKSWQILLDELVSQLRYPEFIIKPEDELNGE